MAKNILIVILILVVPILIYFVFFTTAPSKTISLDLNGLPYHLEVAKTLMEKANGLMNRSHLCPRCGMIFVFDSEVVQTFWMKNTHIPLDIIFLDRDGKIINIHTAPPQAKNDDGSFKLFSSTAPARYVIELNAGDAQKLNLKPHDQIKLPQL